MIRRFPKFVKRFFKKIKARKYTVNIPFSVIFFFPGLFADIPHSAVFATAAATRLAVFPVPYKFSYNKGNDQRDYYRNRYCSAVILDKLHFLSSLSYCLLYPAAIKTSRMILPAFFDCFYSKNHPRFDKMQHI